MPDLAVIWWRDIPAQVVVGSGRGATRAVLPDRFQEAIDAAAMRAGLYGSDEYLTQWRRVTHAVDGDATAAVADECARLDARYSNEELADLVQSNGKRAAAT